MTACATLLSVVWVYSVYILVLLPENALPAVLFTLYILRVWSLLTFSYQFDDLLYLTHQIVHTFHQPLLRLTVTSSFQAVGRRQKTV